MLGINIIKICGNVGENILASIVLESHCFLYFFLKLRIPPLHSFTRNFDK